MSEPTELPPDLPPEYAEAYRRGFEGATSWYDEPLPEEFEPEPREAPRWLVPVLIGTLVLAVVLGAYGLGRLFAEAGSHPSSTSADQERTSKPRPRPVEGQAWEGEVSPVTPEVASSSCVLGPSEDAAGRPVTYDPVNAVDGDFSTAWRCAGDGQGVTLRLTLGEQLTLGELGLVPGYAKTDPQSGADRYAENNRLTRVRWTFSDGSSVVQRLDGSPVNRDLQTLRIPAVKTDELTLEILDSDPGPRNTVAISEIVLGETLS